MSDASDGPAKGESMHRAIDEGIEASPPILLVVPDQEARTDVRRPVLGRPLVERTSDAARRAGFASVCFGPGSRAPSHAMEVATGDRVRQPALVVYEGTFVHPRLLELMVAHPLEPDEAYTLYDDVGRPAAAFVGRLETVPSTMLISEELPWPDGFGNGDVVRILYDVDRRRAESLVLRAEGLAGSPASWWRRGVELPLLRLLAGGRRPLAQLELVALASAIAALPLALWGVPVGLVLAALGLLFGVQVSWSLAAVAALRAEPAARLDHRLMRATRPLGHAALMGGLTYDLVAQTDRSGVAATVLLVAGTAATLLCLFQARLLLRGRPADVFALPNVDQVAQRLGVRWPPRLELAPMLELVILLSALTGIAAAPWSVLAASAVARLWRWFVAGDLPSFSRPGRPEPTAEPLEDPGVGPR